MKKMILMLMAMVVFGNVLGGWTPDALEVKNIWICPSVDGPEILFTEEDYGDGNSVNWYKFVDPSTPSVNEITGNEKAVLSALIAAKLNGMKVHVYRPDNTKREFTSFRLLK